MMRDDHGERSARKEARKEYIKSPMSACLHDAVCVQRWSVQCPIGCCFIGRAGRVRRAICGPCACAVMLVCVLRAKVRKRNPGHSF
jgi:hypothetical protein